MQSTTRMFAVRCGSFTEGSFVPRFPISRFTIAPIGVGLLCALLALTPSTADAQQPAPPDPNGGLPPTFRPNPPIPKQIEDEKITEEEYSAWKKKGLDYQKALQSTSLKASIAGKSAQEWIEEGARVRVSRLSQKTNRRLLSSLRAEVTRELILNLRTPSVREFYIAEIIKNCDILTTGNITVRMHALKLIGDLNLVAAGVGLRGPPAIASPAGLPVLKKIIDAELNVQPEAVKIFAARSIIRILTEGRLPNNDKMRDQIALSIINEIEKKRDPALERVLINALVETELSMVNNNNVNQALIVYTLTRIVLDRNRTYAVRCEAAEALGVSPMPAGTNGQVLAYAVAQLAGQLATDYNQGKVNKRFAVFRMQNIFFALRGRAGKATTDGKSVSGLINTSKHADLSSLHSKHVLPMASSIYSSVQAVGAPPQTLNAASAAAMLQWAKPASMVLHTSLPEVTQNMQPKAKVSADPPESTGP
jgi:hypothetical protein